jgi:hypothetical protein
MLQNLEKKYQISSVQLLSILFLKLWTKVFISLTCLLIHLFQLFTSMNYFFVYFWCLKIKVRFLHMYFYSTTYHICLNKLDCYLDSWFIIIIWNYGYSQRKSIWSNLVWHFSRHCLLWIKSIQTKIQLLLRKSSTYLISWSVSIQSSIIYHWPILL